MGRERKKWNATPTPPSKCVNATDKGVRPKIDGKATNKGVRREAIVRLKAGTANREMCGGMGKRSRWRAGECMLPFSRPRSGDVGQGELSGVTPPGFHRGTPKAQLVRRLQGCD